jgi:hypothetical protein
LAIRIGTLKLRHIRQLSKQERRDVARWLRWHAKHLVKHGKAYSARLDAGLTFY